MTQTFQKKIDEQRELIYTLRKKNAEFRNRFLLLNDENTFASNAVHFSRFVLKFCNTILEIGS